MSSQNKRRPVVLCVLDGWGYREDPENNAPAQAKTPEFRKKWDSCPHALLNASGEAVGLPAGQIGNSEVGHMNLGAGRVVFQDLPMINNALAKGQIDAKESLNDLAVKLKKTGGTCHIMGLASPGGVHAHQDHMVALAGILAQKGVPVNIHAFLDGRDMPPQSAASCIEKMQADLTGINGVKITSLCGRYYAMDRDKRWERVEKAYDLLTQGSGSLAQDPVEAIKKSYENGVTDEFVLPVAIDGYQGMCDGDGILFANFRADRAREILSALLEPVFEGFPRKKTISFAAAVGMVEYSDRLNAFIRPIFPPKPIVNTLGEIIANEGLRQLRIAETEKYPHVTFFFNGGREDPYPNEERIMIPSPKVATYDQKPEMSAYEVTDRVVEAIRSNTFDLIILNYANPDMVGHTGSLKAAVAAVEVVDQCLEKLFSAIEDVGGAVLLTADHGNCETMHDPATQGPHTAHTLAPVPVILVNAPSHVTRLRDGKLADVAPTLLALMGLAKPSEMDGETLLVG